MGAGAASIGDNAGVATMLLMGDGKNELADKIQAKLGRVLTSHEREILETDNYLLASELGFPLAVHKLLGSWRSSFKKIATLYSPGTPVGAYATNALLRRVKKFNKNILVGCIAISSLIVLVSVLAVLYVPAIPLKLGIVASAVLVFSIVAFVILDTRRLLFLFQQNERLRAILLDLVDNSPGLKEIYICTPRPWREIFLGSPPKDLEGMAKLVAWNLDWYIARPSIHFRWSWMVGIVLIGYSLAFGIGVWNDYLFAPFVFFGYGLLPLLHVHESWRKLTGLALLIEETKRIFSETEKG